MIEREKNILNAAKTVFSQYGIKRTTMNDIAEHAEVSRQTLYNSFENKEAIFKAIIRLYTEETLNALHAHNDGSDDLNAGLELVFHHLAFIPFDIMHSTAHGADVIEGIGNAAAPELTAANAAFRDAIAEMFKPHEKQLQKSHLSGKEFSELIAHTTLALKHHAQDRKQLEGLLNSFKITILKTLT